MIFLIIIIIDLPYYNSFFLIIILLLILLLLLLLLLLLMFRWRHAAVVLAVYIVMGQCGGKEGDYEGYGRLAGKSEVIPSAERSSSKFHSFPPSFAPRPAVHFWNNLSALDITFNTPASRKGVYLFKTLRIISSLSNTVERIRPVNG